MSSELQNLVERYQAGENVRGEIEDVIFDEAIEEKIFYNNPWLVGYEENDDIFKNSLDYSLEKYRFDMKMKFSSYFYMVYFDRLKNERQRVRKEKFDGVTIKNMEAFQEAVKDILGSPVDNEIINNTAIFNDEILNHLKPKVKDYIALYLTFATKKMTLTDDIAGQILGRTRRTVINYRAKLKELLSEHGNYKDYEFMIEQSKEQLSLYNEHGIPDPTPYQAMKTKAYGPESEEIDYSIITENIKTAAGTTGPAVLVHNDAGDDKTWEKGYCSKCHLPLTTAGKCSNTNNCNR